MFALTESLETFEISELLKGVLIKYSERPIYAGPIKTILSLNSPFGKLPETTRWKVIFLYSAYSLGD